MTAVTKMRTDEVALRKARMLIGGNWVDSASGEVLEVEDPAHRRPIAEVPRGGPEDVARAVHAAVDIRLIEHRAASGKQRKTRAGWSGEGQAVLCVQTAKKRPFSLTQNQPPKTGKVAEARSPHQIDAQGGGNGSIRTFCDRTSILSSTCGNERSSSIRCSHGYVARGKRRWYETTDT
jgi:hypothetical protein